MVERTSASLSLSWDVFPRPRSQSQPIQYKLTYRKKVPKKSIVKMNASLITVKLVVQRCFSDILTLRFGFSLVSRGQDDNLVATTIIVRILEKNFVHVVDLTPGTAYMCKVQALGSDGSPGGSSIEEQFETSPEGTENRSSTATFQRLR